MLSDKGEATRAAIVQLIEQREQRLGGSDNRIRNGLRAMLVSTGPVVDLLSGLDDEGWETWIRLQWNVSCALSGQGGIGAIQAAADDLDVGADRAANSG